MSSTLAKTAFLIECLRADLFGRPSAGAVSGEITFTATRRFCQRGGWWPLELARGGEGRFTPASFSSPSAKIGGKPPFPHPLQFEV